MGLGGEAKSDQALGREAKQLLNSNPPVVVKNVLVTLLSVAQQVDPSRVSNFI
jgi:hypothetical protein